MHRFPIAIIEEKANIVIVILEKSIDLSRLKVTALDVNKYKIDRIIIII
jgi:hypothetical protein